MNAEHPKDEQRVIMAVIRTEMSRAKPDFTLISTALSRFTDANMLYLDNDAYDFLEESAKQGGGEAVWGIFFEEDFFSSDEEEEDSSYDTDHEEDSVSEGVRRYNQFSTLWSSFAL